jgi:anti-sigma factor RsiW
MKMDDILLMGYVDGTLSDDERQEVERAIGISADIAERIARLKASQLPFKDAFSQQSLPPVPESLAKQIEALARSHASPDGSSSASSSAPFSAPSSASSNTAKPDPGTNDAVLHHDASLPPSAPVRSRLRFAPSWLAVGFAAGVFCFGIVLRFAPGAVPWTNPTGMTVAAGNAQASPWVLAAANYQDLFARETVENVQPDAQVAAKTVDDIRHVDGLALRVPDLRSAGLTFKGVNRLRFNNKPLVQIVYLPEKGAPIALCVMKDMQPDTPVAQQQVDKMNVVTWRQAELKYALIGHPGEVDLTALGKQISGSSVDALFSQTRVRGNGLAG